MFFQINVTPKEKKVAKPREPIIQNYDLLLAPFQPPTRIKLETRINTKIECQLTIRNTNSRALTVSVVKTPPQERCLSLSTTEWSIQPESSVILNILWEPQEGGSWRDILQLSDSRRIKYDVPLTFTCIDPNKKVNEKGKKGKQRNPLSSKLADDSNVQKYNSVPKKIIQSNGNDKNINSKSKSQPPVKRSIEPDKENVTSNAGFNWMIDQAKTKKQKKEQPPAMPQLDFSKFIDSTTFKFTPIKSKFTCMESNTVQDSITFTPQQDFNKPNESWIFKQESTTVESKVQMTLRKETYIKVPKDTGVIPNLKLNDETTEEFDDSLSPKPTETEKPQSDISMLLNDIKFTPYKNPFLKSNENLKFSPDYCSTGTKLNKSKLFTEDALESKNETFDINTSTNSKVNNTYELPLSPTSTRKSFQLKPTCLAETFDKNNTDIGFSTPFSVNKQCNNINNHSARFSNQFSRSQIDFGSVKDCLEADMWVNSKKPSMSPVTKNLMHSTLDSICEEDIANNEENAGKINHDYSSDSYQETAKKPEVYCIEISPPKKCVGSKPPIRKVSPMKQSKIRKEKYAAETVNYKKRVQIKNSIKCNTSNGTVQIPGVRITKLSLSELHKDKNKNISKPTKKQPREVSVKLHNPNDFLSMICNPDPFAATMTVDPFLSGSLYYDDKWVFIQELEFKKWLNALLTPPEHLTADVESTTIDVGKVWQFCRSKDVTLAETKESISARYHTNTRLNTLRKAACVMYRKPEVITALSQTTVGIEKEILVVRPDKDLHRDIGLQKLILELFISYNPLWLRIGLETIYGETIPLQSNNDLIGLSRFLLGRFFSDPFLVKLHSSNAHPNIRLKTFQPLINKFMLKKFLFLVYFLDYAKRNKLIGHDPCLFHKKAQFKDSRSILLTFSREVLSGIGDITKVLRNYNYVVSHKQTYLDEYDYAVMNLSTDLRDGVRLCRVMELITGKNCLTSVRVPAVSRLQKVHNVSVALTTLNVAGYTITGNIDAKSIADGHKEKTLSLLWQIIYKFQAPKFEKAAKTLQRWWRSKMWYVYIKNMLRNRKNNAASIIQRAWKCFLAKRELQILKENYARELQIQNEAARKLQSRWRLKKLTREQQKQYQHIRKSSMKIQKWWRRIQFTKPYVMKRKTTLRLVIQVQRRWRAIQLMKSERQNFINTKINAIKIQRYWRAIQLGKQVRKNYQSTRTVIIFIQKKWRAKMSMKIERASYLQKMKAINFIQEWWRHYLIYKRDQNYFKALKKSVRVIEDVWIAKNTVTEDRKHFLVQKSSSIIIQKMWRNYQATKNDVLRFKLQKQSCIKIQAWWRSVVVRQQIKEQRLNCIKLQKWWRGVLLTRKEHSKFLTFKKSAIIIQKNWKMQIVRRDYKCKKVSVLKIECWYANIIISQKIRQEYLKIKVAARTIESKWLALKAGRNAKAQYLEAKKLIINLQQKWRAQILMKKTRDEYLRRKNTAVKIQSWWRMIQQKQRYAVLKKKINAAIILQRRWRALRSGKKVALMYIKYKSSTILIQRKWRATLLARLVRKNFLQKRNSAIVIQNYWRSFVLSREFKAKKNAVLIIENWRMHNLLGKQVRSNFLKLKLKTIQIQRLWRTKQEMRKFQKQRTAAIVVQKNFRMYIALSNFRKNKRAAETLQRWRRHIIYGRSERAKFIKLKETTLKLQSYWRTKQLAKQFKIKREAAITIEKHWRRVVAMKKYEKKKIAVLFIENWRKHVLFGRQVRQEFLKQKAAIIKVQRIVRVQLQIRKFRKQRDAAIKIQRFWRSVLEMRRCKRYYEQKKAAAIVLQRRYRAIKIAEQVRINYHYQILAMKSIQRWWRKILCRKQLEITKRKQKSAVIFIENWWIKASEKRRIRKAKEAELERISKAVTKIQTVWRGFKVRQTASRELAMLRERAKKAAEAAVPTATLAFRLQENIEIFKYASNIGQLSICLSSLDIITRLSPNACINVCQLNLVPKLYDILTRANRSLPWLDVCLQDISILLTLAKFKPTTAYVLQEEYIEVLVRLLTISIDKKDDLFLHTATLMWVLTENYDYKEAVKNCSRTKYLLSSLYTSINKKLNKHALNSTQFKRDALPSPKPDWGLKHKRPRTFSTVYQAIKSIASRLKILNINHSTDMQRSFNFSM